MEILLKWMSIALFAAAIDQACALGDDLVDEIVRSGLLVIATDPSSSPLNIKTIDGQYVGFEVDLAEEIAKEFGPRVRVLWKPMKWDRIPELVKSQKVHLGLNGIFIELDPRARKDGWAKLENQWGAYSDPYLITGLTLVYPAREGKLTFEKLLDRKEKSLVGIFNDPFVIPIMERFGLKFRIWDQAQGHLIALEDGVVDYVVFDAPMVSQFIKERLDRRTRKPQFSRMSGLIPGSTGGYAVLMRLESTLVRDKVNAAIGKWRSSPDTRKKWGEVFVDDKIREQR